MRTLLIDQEIVYQQPDKFQLPPNFRGKSGVLVQVWWLVQNLLFKPSPQFMYGWRRWLLRSLRVKEE
ncbi:hypothetical protein PZB74_04185 [Porifericola rhodea]|uniref:hypothetical protein n=1 Tax=Porifericola rhodea TaxID=930972 RepID=UPI00266572DF|nr:hypothetical protein [Porifericola rhodea]WKN32542.1 hypothetical protein PZB74_04185 [Porifericola rhodea]